MGDIVFIFAFVSLNPPLLIENLDVVFDCLKFAAELNVAFGFVFKNVDYGSCRFYAHENNTLIDRPNLVPTEEDYSKSITLLKILDVIESCTKERASTKCNFYNLVNVIFFCFTQGRSHVR